jgi:DNA-binding transcriptional ArsR family regulator
MSVTTDIIIPFPNEGESKKMSRADFSGARSSEGFDEWTALEAVTQDSRANLISDMVGHPDGMPSMAELEYMNPSLTRSTITGHLDVLKEAGVVATAEFPTGQRPGRDLPYKFYYITEQARDLFDRSNIFEKGIWQDTYAQVKKTEDIERYEEVTRPQRR